MLSRREILVSMAVSAAALAIPLKADAQSPAPTSLTIEDLKTFQRIAALEFTDEELLDCLSEVNDRLAGYRAVRQMPIDERTQAPLMFSPLEARDRSAKPGVSVSTSLGEVGKPKNDEDLAFMSVCELSSLVHSRQVTSQGLTELYLDRLERYGDKLLCVVTLLKERARQRAKQMDVEMSQGKSRGPLHGIPCGIKDLFALKGAPTTWGAGPFENQVLDYDSAIAERLDRAGAVILAKLSMGALAMGDVWFKGTTKNPWNPKEGSSGSSAGSASATAAGLVGFSIGTETLGSICSPSHQCRVTGLRPTFGRVSRYGAMELSYSMDKVGPICRRAEDCALVLAAIVGADPRDRSTTIAPFHYRPLRDLKNIRIGFLSRENQDIKAYERSDEGLKILVGLGADPQPVRITPCPDGLLEVLDVEAGSAFDRLTRSETDIAKLKDSSWPTTFRGSRFIPAVEYLQAMRGRRLLMENFERELGDFDLIYAPGEGGTLLEITNLTGHPQVLIPFGQNANGRPRSVSLIGRLYEEDRLLQVAHLLQDRAAYFKTRPNLSELYGGPMTRLPNPLPSKAGTERFLAQS